MLATVTNQIRANVVVLNFLKVKQTIIDTHNIIGWQFSGLRKERNYESWHIYKTKWCLLGRTKVVRGSSLGWHKFTDQLKHKELNQTFYQQIWPTSRRTIFPLHCRSWNAWRNHFKNFQTLEPKLKKSNQFPQRRTSNKCFSLVW